MIEEQINIPCHVFLSNTQKKKYGSCERKVKFSLKAADLMIKRGAKRGDYLRVYLCPYCEWWHLTSKK